MQKPSDLNHAERVLQLIAGVAAVGEDWCSQIKNKRDEREHGGDAVAVLDGGPRLIPSAFACLVIGRSCWRSIIALRSAGRLC